MDEPVKQDDLWDIDEWADTRKYYRENWWINAMLQINPNGLHYTSEECKQAWERHQKNKKDS